MDVTTLIDPLNDAQRQAVTAPGHSVLVLAGAGSGKTRVLVHRIAWQIQVCQFSPQAILAVTFTNKAATEMRNRIETLLNLSTRGMWVGTFHGLAHRLLRRHAQEAKLPETFQVIDSDDQLRLIKRLLKSLDLEESRWPPRQIQWFINGKKEEGIRAGSLPETGDMFENKMIELYRAYEQICHRTGVVDFAELLLRVHELLRDNAELLDFYQQRFKHIHIDEFQDTNTIQYAWLRLLAGANDNLFAVGDDDQSIYGWRGARIENLFNFQQHFPGHQLIRLEQNYRSTGNILNAANQLIGNNQSRLGKTLWTDSGEGELISVYEAFNEQDEAYFVIEQIKKWINEGGQRSDIAILYRSNAQSRLFEERLMSGAIPYRVYGGLRFFERAEIKNVLAFLRLVSNQTDDGSFERVINTPARGIGARTLQAIRDLAREKRVSLWQSAEFIIHQQLIPARAVNALRSFLQLILNLKTQIEDLDLHEQVKCTIEQCGLIEFYKKEKGEKGEARIENMEELVNAARQFALEEDSAGDLNELDLFLSHAALEAGDMQADSFDDCVQLMTLHSAKGLEFKAVFMVGFEEGLFPSQQSVEDAGRLEEERRLCYVGMTRAMQKLTITYAESRRLYGRENYPRPSRFLREIPEKHYQEVRLRAEVVRAAKAIPKKTKTLNSITSTYKLGQRVKHDKFGEGVVLQIEGEGAQERVQVNFAEAGMKWLMLAYAKLETLT